MNWIELALAAQRIFLYASTTAVAGSIAVVLLTLIEKIPNWKYSQMKMTALEAITESRRLMNGKKWRLFCLNLSFIGWEFLCDIPTVIATAILLSGIAGNGIVTALFWLIPGMILSIIGNLFLMPYQEAAHAVFYREL